MDGNICLYSLEIESSSCYLDHQIDYDISFGEGFTTIRSGPLRYASTEVLYVFQFLNFGARHQDLLEIRTRLCLCTNGNEGRNSTRR